MARVITRVDVGDPALPGHVKHQVYNALDCCVTHEVHGVLEPRLDDITRRIYRVHLAQQAPAMEMMVRGVAVDREALTRGVRDLKAELVATTRQLQTEVAPWWRATELETGRCPANAGKPHQWPRNEPDDTRSCKGCGAARIRLKPFNPGSPDQTAQLFYNHMRLPVQHNSKTDNQSADKECLERLANNYDDAAPIVALILEARSYAKQIGVLKSGVSWDGRMRSSFNVAGAYTGRWSSSSNAFREGTNLQNIADKVRYIFVADPGMELVYADLQQAESNTVAYLADDEAYIAAHKSGDVHTYVARLVWPDLPWTGDLKADRKIAEETCPPWSPSIDYRRHSKVMQHGSNYLLTPRGMARRARIKVKIAAEVQATIYNQFHRVRAWQLATADTVRRTGAVTTPLGRRHKFLGRTWDPHTIRQAVAFVPQSMVGDILNAVLWRVWHEMDPGGPPVPETGAFWPLAQVHDAILGLRRAGDDTALLRLRDLMTLPVRIGARTMVLGVDFSIGQNWGKRTPTNPRGLSKWTP